jgi:hypothetical protein
MCQLQRLYAGDNGYVVKCDKCGFYQLGFGTVMLTFSETNFSYFKKLLALQRDEWAFQQNELLKNIVIPLPSGEMKLLLCKKELNELNGMLDAAECEETALVMLDLFNA